MSVQEELLPKCSTETVGIPHSAKTSKSPFARSESDGWSAFFMFVIFFTLTFSAFVMMWMVLKLESHMKLRVSNGLFYFSDVFVSPLFVAVAYLGTQCNQGRCRTCFAALILVGLRMIPYSSSNLSSMTFFYFCLFTTSKMVQREKCSL